MLGLVYHSGGGYASVRNGGLPKNFHKFFVVFQGFYSLYFGMSAQKKPLCSDIFRFYHFIPLFMIYSPFVHSARCPIFRTERFQGGSWGETGFAAVSAGRWGQRPLQMGSVVSCGHGDGFFPHPPRSKTGSRDFSQDPAAHSPPLDNPAKTGYTLDRGELLVGGQPFRLLKKM